MSHWLAEGRTLGASLRRFNCIVVAGPDPDATAEVALGVAEAQAAHRRVVLGDLLDDAARFATLRVDDDHHGIVDALHYGISMARITRPVADTPGLLFAPTGSVIADYAELLEHPRWSRLIASFTESGELFVIALPLGVSGFEGLAAHTDGVILVDGLAPAKLDPARVIARVQPTPSAPPPVPAPAPVPPPPRASIPAAGAAAAAAGPGVPRGKPPAAPAQKTTPAARRSTSTAVAERPSNQVATRPATKTDVEARRPISPAVSAGKRIPGLSPPVVVGALLSLVGALFVYWLAERPMADSPPPARPVAAAVPSLLKSGAADTRKPVDPNMIDPADSGAAAYAVQITSANTQAGAILKLQQYGSSLPTATYAPVAIQGTTWFKVLAGAYTTRGGADSLLTSLRSERLLDSTEGVVVRVPFAIRIDSVRSATTVNDYLVSLSLGRQLPAYVLMQRNGWVWVLVGAFETRSQADMYAQTLRAVGQTPEPTIVYRQGRMF